MSVYQTQAPRTGTSSPLQTFNSRLEGITKQVSQHQTEPSVLEPALARLETLIHTLQQAIQERWLYELVMLDRDCSWLKAQLRQLYHLHHGNMDIPPGREKLDDAQLAALHKTATAWLRQDAYTWYRALPKYPRLQAYLVDHAIDQHQAMLHSNQREIRQTIGQAKRLVQQAEQLWQQIARQLDQADPNRSV